jgi:hypothetical protein
MPAPAKCTDERRVHDRDYAVVLVIIVAIVMRKGIVGDLGSVNSMLRWHGWRSRASSAFCPPTTMMIMTTKIMMIVMSMPMTMMMMQIMTLIMLMQVARVALQGLVKILPSVRRPCPELTRGHVLRALCQMLASTAAEDRITALQYLSLLSPDRAPGYPEVITQVRHATTKKCFYLLFILFYFILFFAVASLKSVPP